MATHDLMETTRKSLPDIVMGDGMTGLISFHGSLLVERGSIDECDTGTCVEFVKLSVWDTH